MTQVINVCNPIFLQMKKTSMIWCASVTCLIIFYNIVAETEAQHQSSPVICITCNPCTKPCPICQKHDSKCKCRPCATCCFGKRRKREISSGFYKKNYNYNFQENDFLNFLKNL